MMTRFVCLGNSTRTGVVGPDWLEMVGFILVHPDNNLIIMPNGQNDHYLTFLPQPASMGHEGVKPMNKINHMAIKLDKFCC